MTTPGSAKVWPPQQLQDDETFMTLGDDDFDPDDLLPAESALKTATTPSDDDDSPRKQKKRRRAPTAAEGKAAAANMAPPPARKTPRKKRILFNADEVTSMTTDKGDFRLKKNPNGKFNTYDLRTFALSVRKNDVWRGEYLSDNLLGIEVEPDTKEDEPEHLMVYVHGRHAKRENKAARERALGILRVLHKYNSGSKSGRYVASLRDFGYGGAAAHRIAQEYANELKGAGNAMTVGDEDAAAVEEPTADTKLGISRMM